MRLNQRRQLFNDRMHTNAACRTGTVWARLLVNTVQRRHLDLDGVQKAQLVFYGQPSN